MGILSRITNVIKAKANKAVEAAEAADPVGIMKAALKEAQENLGQFESAVRDHGAEKIRLEKKVEDLKANVKKWGSNAEAAMGEGNEALAEKACERQTEYETELASTKAALKATSDSFEKMTTKIISEKKKMDACKAKMSSLEARQKAAQANLKMKETLTAHEGSGSALDRISVFEDKISDLENKVTASDELEEAVKGEDLDSQFEELENKGSTSDKMAALKAKIAKKETEEA